MSIKCIKAAELGAWAGEVALRRHRTYAPQAKADRFAYDLLERPQALRLDHDVTLLPPRKYFSPPRETLMQFDGANYQAPESGGPFVLFGVHPYDVAAIGQADTYYSDTNCDCHYMAHRKSAVIVACDVQNAAPNVFAGCMGTATVNKGFDLLLTLVGDKYVADARTEAGEALLELAGPVPDADPISLARREQVWQIAPKFLRRHNLRVPLDALPGLLGRSHEHPVWERKSAMCYSCGSCVTTCPTCFCFDVQDEMQWDLSKGVRVRKWDACLVRDFALVAGGHNFRKHREERYRHRFYRKGKYLPERMNFVACVGCGRCATACTTKIANPVEVYNALLEDR